MDLLRQLHPRRRLIVIKVLTGIVLKSLEEARRIERRESLRPDEAVPVLERIR